MVSWPEPQVRHVESISLPQDHLFIVAWAANMSPSVVARNLPSVNQPKVATASILSPSIVNWCEPCTA